VSVFVWTRGLQGSGKTTYARAWVAEDFVNRVRVNQDDLRGMMHDGMYLGDDTENAIKLARRSLVARLLRTGYDVISDDCNLSPLDAEWVEGLAWVPDVQIVCVDLRDVPLDVCLKRNHGREGRARIPEEVIRNLHTLYIEPLTASAHER